MRHLLPTILLLCCTLATLTRSQEFEPVLPEPSVSYSTDDLRLELFFEELQQGRVGLLRLTGDDIASAALTVFNRRVDFFNFDIDGVHFALMAVNLDQAKRAYTATVTATNNANVPTEPLQFAFEVTDGGFIQQTVQLVNNDRIEELLDADVEQAELSQIFSLAAESDGDPLWDGVGFIPPIAGALTSPFGAVRVFNNTYETRHTGWDFNATIGLPMRASANGIVAYAGFLPIRGNYVLIDHGYGVLSGYAHLSVVHVTQGQPIATGQVIGQVGSTGRSSSAHAHIEFIVDGNWVDAADFLVMPLP